MNRRNFICTVGGITLFAFGEWAFGHALSGNKNIRFGVLTDMHYADREPSGARVYRHSLDKLAQAVEQFNGSRADFVIELGDFKDAGNSRSETLAFLDEAEKGLQRFDGQIYHVLGNHDTDNISKSDFLAHTSNHGRAKGKKYYSFTCKGIKFIALDANFNEDGSDYDSGNFEWTNAFIPEHQKAWLDKELDTRSPVVVFIHQLLDSFSDGVPQEVCVNNAPEIVELLERRNNVLAVFQGHHHAGHYSFRNGIHYVTLNGMIEGSFPENNSFALVEIAPSSDVSVDGFFNCKDRELKRKV